MVLNNVTESQEDRDCKKTTELNVQKRFYL